MPSTVWSLFMVRPSRRTVPAAGGCMHAVEHAAAQDVPDPMHFDSQGVERFAELRGKLPVARDFRRLVCRVIVEDQSSRSLREVGHAPVEASMLVFALLPKLGVPIREKRGILAGRFEIRRFAPGPTEPFVQD